MPSYHYNVMISLLSRYDLLTIISLLCRYQHLVIMVDNLTIYNPTTNHLPSKYISILIIEYIISNIFILITHPHQVNGLCMGISEGRWDTEQINRLDSLWRLLVRPVFLSCFVKGLLWTCFWRTVYDNINIYCPEWEQKMHQRLGVTGTGGGIYLYDCTIDHFIAVLVLMNFISWLAYPPLAALGRRAYNAIRDENYLIGRRLQVGGSIDVVVAGIVISINCYSCSSHSILPLF